MILKPISASEGQTNSISRSTTKCLIASQLTLIIVCMSSSGMSFPDYSAKCLTEARCCARFHAWSLADFCSITGRVVFILCTVQKLYPLFEIKLIVLGRQRFLGLPLSYLAAGLGVEPSSPGLEPGIIAGIRARSNGGNNRRLVMQRSSSRGCGTDHLPELCCPYLCTHTCHSP